MRTRSILVVHREALMAESIAAALSRYSALGPIAIATTSREAIREAPAADAAVVDGLMDRAEVTVRALHRSGLRVVVLGGPEGDEDEEGGQRVTLGASVDDLARALSPQLMHRVSAADALTPREREVLSLVADGLVAKQVARQLGISEKTVESHKARMFAKLGVTNQTAAVSVVLTGGLGAAGRVSWNHSRI